MRGYNAFNVKSTYFYICTLYTVQCTLFNFALIFSLHIWLVCLYPKIVNKAKPIRPKFVVNLILSIKTYEIFSSDLQSTSHNELSFCHKLWFSLQPDVGELLYSNYESMDGKKGGGEWIIDSKYRFGRRSTEWEN